MGLFYLRQVPTILNDHQVRPRNGLLIKLGTLQGHEPVISPPHDASWYGNPIEQTGQPEVVHIGLPTKPNRHLPVALCNFHLLRAGRLAVDLLILGNLTGIVKQQLGNLGRADDEDVGNLALLGLDAYVRAKTRRDYSKTFQMLAKSGRC